MAQNAKKIREAEKERTMLIREMDALKTRLGYALLVKDPLFAELSGKKESVEKAHTTVSELENRISSYTAEMASAAAEQAVIKKDLEIAVKQLGDYLFSCADQTLGSELYAMHGKIRSAEDTLSHLEADIAAAGFFKKVPLQVKKTSLQATLAAEKNKFSQQLYQKARSIVMEKQPDGMSGSSEYDECSRLREELDRVNGLQAQLTADKTAAESERRQTGTDITALEQSCKQLELQCNDRALTEADSYVAQYISEKAAVLKQFPKANKTALQDILALYCRLTENERTTELLKLEDAIADCTAQIAKMQADYDASQRAIAELESHCKELTANIAGSRSLIENYESRRAVLAEELAATAEAAVDSGSEEPGDGDSLQ